MEKKENVKTLNSITADYHLSAVPKFNHLCMLLEHVVKITKHNIKDKATKVEADTESCVWLFGGSGHLVVHHMPKKKLFVLDILTDCTKETMAKAFIHLTKHLKIKNFEIGARENRGVIKKK